MPSFEMTMTMFWLIAMVFFLVVEAVTVGLVCIWFAAGSLVALLCAMFDAPVWLQIVVFLIVSAVTLYYTRPLVKKYVNNKVEPTNADIVIGKECRVTETIDNIAGTGAVYVDGKTWTARSADDSETIPEGTLVTARQIDGVKLIVSAMEKETIRNNKINFKETANAICNLRTDTSCAYNHRKKYPRRPAEQGHDNRAPWQISGHLGHRHPCQDPLL